MTLADLRALCERAIEDPTRDDYEHALVVTARTRLPALIEVANILVATTDALGYLLKNGSREPAAHDLADSAYRVARAALARLDEVGT